jgi:hypothetical protein
MNEFLLERRESIRTQREAELRSSLQERHLHHVHTVPSTPAQQASDSESDDVDDSNNGELNVSASPSAPAAATGDCHSINLMLQRNRVWRENVTKSDPTFFERLSVRQTPEFLAIGCSDSRVSIELLTGVGVGELFVHRNIANMVVNTDISCLSVIQYAVEVLKVRMVYFFIFLFFVFPTLPVPLFTRCDTLSSLAIASAVVSEHRSMPSRSA